MDYEIIADGLRFPEGPVVMSDGSVIVVEIESKKITRCWPGGKRETVAEPGGGPNGLAIGPDGKLWCTNNGGFIYHDRDGLLIPGHRMDPDQVVLGPAPGGARRAASWIWRSGCGGCWGRALGTRKFRMAPQAQTRK